MPWRRTENPYRILVSEVMLQQTQVDRVVGYYRAFLKSFPTARALAGASPADVLRVWKGLGYNRRALNLQRAAQMIVRDFCGRFPRDVIQIEKLPGVGPYTARAVCVFAFNQPQVLIETNVRRVFIYFFGNRNDISDKELLPIIERALYRKNYRMWYNALMDYGALALGHIENPNRKSRHYTKQSRFEGSRRYARAKILDYLLQHSSGTLIGLQRFFENDPHLKEYRPSLESLLATLAAEGFIARKGRGWMLKGQ
ncbi:MAG: A/G-specific adenine glycosylase [Patescibacteria group bacterium]